MKKIIYIILTFSICLNLYLILNNYKYSNEFKLVKSLESNKLDENCYNMYSNYYLNSDGLEFNLPFVEKCLTLNIFKTPYELDGTNSKILIDMFNHKSSLNSKYIDSMKYRFNLKPQIIDKASISLAIQIINDIDFIKGLVEKSINGNNKELLFLYLNEYKKLSGDNKYINSIIEKINGDYEEYGYDKSYNSLFNN